MIVKDRNFNPWKDYFENIFEELYDDDVPPCLKFDEVRLRLAILIKRKRNASRMAYITEEIERVKKLINNELWRMLRANPDRISMRMYRCYMKLYPEGTVHSISNY